MFNNHSCCRYSHYQGLSPMDRRGCLPIECRRPHGVVTQTEVLIVITVMLVVTTLVALGQTASTAVVVVGAAGFVAAEVLHRLVIAAAGAHAR